MKFNIPISDERREMIEQMRPQREATDGQFKALVGGIVLGVTVLVGAELAHSYQHHQECETVLDNPQSTVDQLSDCN